MTLQEVNKGATMNDNSIQIYTSPDINIILNSAGSSDWSGITGKPIGIVIDSSYVHTDNNYTTIDKQSVAQITNKADKSDTYTKEECDEKITSAVTGGVDLTAYAKTVDVNNNLTLKADKSTTYTKTEVDSKISSIPTPDVSGQISTHNTSTTAHNDIRTTISAETTRAEGVEATKVDKVNGKQLSTNDLTNDLKTGYDSAVTSSHNHANKTLLDTIISNGDGTKFLADNGNYKTVTSSGGASSADLISYNNPTYTTVQSALDKLLYISPLITSFTGGGTYEIGQTISTITFNWNYNKTMVSQSLTDVGTLSNDLKTYILSGLNLTANKTYTLTANDGTNNCNASTSVSFMNKRYWGVSANASLSNSDILSMTSEFSSNRNQTRTFNCSGGKYFYIIYPASFGVATFKVGGLAFSDTNLTTQNFTNASGYTNSYYIYRCNNIQNGSSINVEVD